MKIVEPSFRILYPKTFDDWMFEFKMIERAGRIAYKTEEAITDTSFLDFCQMIKEKKHGAVLEFGNMVVEFVTDRGVTHELVRHRLCSFLQESTRYCNYAHDRFDNQISVICPHGLSKDQKNIAFEAWCNSVMQSETAYFQLLEAGETPQIARSVLPTCTKTEIVVKANFREWLHIFDLRVLGKTGKPHPDMVRLMKPLHDELVAHRSWFWGDAEK